jgi:hypothetical protein
MADLSREEVIKKHPGPYSVRRFDKHDREVDRIPCPTLRALEVEVDVSDARVRDPADAAARYEILGIPAELVRGRISVRERENSSQPRAELRG